MNCCYEVHSSAGYNLLRSILWNGRNFIMEEELYNPEEDNSFKEPYTDTEEWRDLPVRHFYVHGGFKERILTVKMKFVSAFIFLRRKNTKQVLSVSFTGSGR